MKIHPEAIKIRPMRPTDIQSAMDIKASENWNQQEEDWDFLLTRSPEYCLVAELDKTVLATVTALAYQQTLAWVGMMLVHKDARGLGLGKRLLSALLAKLQDFPSIKLDATPVGFGLYQKLGFVAEYEICRMTRSKDIANKPSENRGGNEIEMLAIREPDLPEIAKFDEKIFGVNRRAVFQYLLNNQPSLCWMLKKENQLLAFSMGRRGSNYAQIGPLVAESGEHARILVQKILIKKGEQALVLDVLVDKKGFQEELGLQGFIPQRNFTRMYLHSNVNQGILEKQYLIAGPELG